jgi:predicted Holliday junction resolvase-like endonuclease
MSIILLIVIVFAIPLIIFYISKMVKIKEAGRRNQEEMGRQTSEKIMRPERKLHEEEKKRWEDEYWKRQERKER